ncbi:MAG: TetR/AcrR family transcriptional regulator [Bauldia litoralis]
MDQPAPLRSEYKRQKRAKRRGEVLDAAAATFAEHGYYAATMQDIAARLGMRPGSLYHYFRSKEEALAEVCRLGGHAFVETMREICAADRPARERLLEAITAHLAEDWRDYVSNFTLHRMAVPESVAPEMAQIARDYLALWVDLVRQGQVTGEIASDLDPRTTATALVGMCNGAAAAFPPPRAAGAGVAERLFGLFLEGAAAR